MTEDNQSPARRPNRPATFLPQGVEVKEGTGELYISIKWWAAGSRSANKFFIFFTLFWNAMLIPFIWAVFASGEWIILLFLSLHFAVGIGMAYFLIARLFNTTEIKVNRQRITSDYGPVKLPTRKPADIPASRVKQLYIKEKEAGRVNGAPRYAYDLMVIQEPGKNLKLVTGMDRITQQYLEQEIEKFLELPDQAVEGETL